MSQKLSMLAIFRVSHVSHLHSIATLPQTYYDQLRKIICNKFCALRAFMNCAGIFIAAAPTKNAVRRAECWESLGVGHKHPESRFRSILVLFPGSHTKQENYSANQLAWLMIWMGDASRIVKMELFLTVIIIMRSRNGSFSEVDLYANFRFYPIYTLLAFPTRLGSLFLSC